MNNYCETIGCETPQLQSLEFGLRKVFRGACELIIYCSFCIWGQIVANSQKIGSISSTSSRRRFY